MHSFWFWESKHHLQIKHLSDQSTRNSLSVCSTRVATEHGEAPTVARPKPNQDQHSFKMWVWSVSLCHDTCCYYGYGLFVAVTRVAFSVFKCIALYRIHRSSRIRFRSNISKFQNIVQTRSIRSGTTGYHWHGSGIQPLPAPVHV